LVAGALALTGSASIGALAQAGSHTGATIDQTGWWNRTNAVVSPVPGVTLPVITVPAPPSVPAGTIAVSATAGQPEKVAAVDISPEIGTGTAERAILTIPEADAGEQIENTSAVIVACPITQFWVGGANGQWSNQPPNSCSTLKIPGTRSADGIWTFDITSIAALWLTPGQLAPNGVALLPEPAAGTGGTFQVVLAGDPADIGIDFAATPPAPRTTAGAPTTAPAATGGSPSPVTSAAPATTVAPTPTTVITTTTTKPVDTSGADSILGNLPGGAFLLVPLVLIAAFLLMLVYGPLGEPATGVAREGGVSRALAARERAATDLTSPIPALEAP
jgi:hypothetical protein